MLSDVNISLPIFIVPAKYPPTINPPSLLESTDKKYTALSSPPYVSIHVGTISSFVSLDAPTPK